MVRAYIVRYWDTQGIFPVEGEIASNGRFIALRPTSWQYSTFSPEQFAFSTNEAIEKAKALREKKLQSLQREAERIINTEIKVNV